MGWTTEVQFPAGSVIEFFLLVTASRTARWPTQPPIQWVLWALTPEVTRPGCEADHSPPASVEIKECMELYLHFPNTSLLRGA